MKISDIVVCVFISFCGSGIALSQSRKAGKPPDFFVQLQDRRSSFYNDEDVPFSVFRRAHKPQGAGCRFGGSGETMQVMKNEHVIKEYSVGPVEATSLSMIHGVPFQSTRGSFGLYNGNKDDVDLAGVPEDAYQIRYTCGQEVSEPSKPFYFSLWNQPVGGLTVLVRPTKSAFRVNEPITVTVEMRNVGKQSLWCPVPLPEDGRSRNFWILESNWDDPRPTTADTLALGRGLRLLPPAASRRAIFRLNNFRGVYNNKSTALGTVRGSYRLWFSVGIHVDDEDIPTKYRKSLWREDLTSNTFWIVVE